LKLVVVVEPLLRFLLSSLPEKLALIWLQTEGLQMRERKIRIPWRF